MTMCLLNKMSILIGWELNADQWIRKLIEPHGVDSLVAFWVLLGSSYLSYSIVLYSRTCFTSIPAPLSILTFLHIA